jgi:peptidoglycan lytic transglycosylase G
VPDGTQVTRSRRQAGGRQRPQRAHRGGRIVALIALVLAAAVIWFLAELFQPFHGSGHGNVAVTVPAHSSSNKVGDLLERDGVISSAFFFELRATLAGDRGKLRSGTYHLKQGMSYGDALKVLTTVPPAPPTTELTIVEGRTRRQIDALLRSEGVHGSYLSATRRSPLLKPRAYGAPRGTNSLEGFLFPSTYELREPIKLGALVADQLRNFRQRFAQVKLGYARRKRMTPYDVLIIASMVQAEAQTAHDRPLVASVIYNRLAAGMPLQIDATTRYATNNYAAPLTLAQLNSPSPFNTRIHKGLPPTPINNPGLDAIVAAAHPRQTNYLFFVVKPCGNGAHVFATNYNAFLAATKRYQSARARRGGRSPAHC